MIKRVFCIGNGESRIGFDLNLLKPYGKIYGCNALYRDFTPDVLISVDPPMNQEIYNDEYSNNNECWFRNFDSKKLINKNIHTFSEIFPNKKDFGWASGTSSAFIAIKQNDPKEVYLIGHDFTSNNNKINNIYKNTKNYADKNTKKRLNINWRNQWRQLFKLFPNIIFFKINNSLEEVNEINKKIEEWKDVSNLTYTTYEKSILNW
jgi:hypothetical protein